MTLRIAPLALGFAVLLAAGGAGAQDLTFGVDLKGTIFSDDAPALKVQCQAKEGNAIRFPGAATSTEGIAALQIAMSCPLHSSNGLFCAAELFDDEPIDEQTTVAVVRDKKGAESAQEILASEKIDAPSEIEVLLEYAAKFGQDKSSGELVPPLKSAGGLLVIRCDASDQFFVGQFKTGKPL